MNKAEFEIVVFKVAHCLRKAMDRDEFPGFNISAFRQNQMIDEDVIRKVQARIITEQCLKIDELRERVRFLEAERTRLRFKILELNHNNYQIGVG